jgi:branched-chain amino acid transport system ATP-binding protein
MRTSDVVLDVDRLEVAYGHVTAVFGVSLTVGERELVALLGANGAGKSTLLRAVSGALRPRDGSVQLRGKRVDGQPARRLARAGITHVPEGRMVVAPLTVEENLDLAARACGRRRGRDITDGFDEVYTTFPQLHDRRKQTSGLLSGGEQQMLAIGRGIMAKPEVLLIDEPSMGLAPIVIEQIYELFRDRPGTLKDTAILLAEQSAALALSVASRAYVLARGAVTYAGPADELDENTMLAAYLGVAPSASGAGTDIGG